MFFCLLQLSYIVTPMIFHMIKLNEVKQMKKLVQQHKCKQSPIMPKVK